MKWSRSRTLRDDSDTGPDRDKGSEARPGMPRWVKMSIMAVLVVALVLVVIALLVGGEHGPGLHTDGADPSVTTSLVFAMPGWT